MERPIHVLLVEDNPADIDLTRETLEMSTFRLDLSTALDGAEALDFLRQRIERREPPPDLILLDLNLPRKDGRATLAEIRATPELAHMPVVVLTSSEAEGDIVQSYQLGANCYVTKSVDFNAFRETLSSVENFWFTVVKLPRPTGD